jgi:hypothetical protein
MASMTRLTIIRTDALLDSLNRFLLRRRKTRGKRDRYSDDQIRELKDFASRYPVRSPYGSLVRLAISLGIDQKSANMAIGRLRRGTAPAYWHASG